MLARVEGNLPFDEGLPCRPLQIARQAIADATQKSGAAIELSCADDLPERCLAMPPALAIAALRNLLENACRHTKAGTSVSLHIALDGPHGVLFKVREQGPGITPERLQRLTERFWRSADSDGSGLGLSIVKAIAERCGCTLQFIAHGDGLEVQLGAALRRETP